MTAAESVNEEAAEAMRRTREFVAGAAFGIPEGDDSSDDPRRRDPGGDYLAALLAAALPLLRPSDVPHLERRIRESIAGEEVERVEYGHALPDGGWLFEHRGIKYATHQRTVRYRLGEPVAIDHWTYVDHRHPVEGCTHERHDLTTAADVAERLARGSSS